MSWRHLRNRDGAIHPFGARACDDRLDWGTLVLEIDLGEAAKTGGPVLRLEQKSDPGRIFAIEPMADGRLHLLRRHGAKVSHLSVGLGREPVSGRLRLSYHWDHKRGRSLLTAENLTRGTIRQQDKPGALPLLRAEISDLFHTKGASFHHPALDWVGLADHWQTVGPAPGLAPNTSVDTPTGARLISELRPGDLVRTADDGDLPVLWQGRIAAPALGRLRQVRLIAPYFGLSRDVTLRSGQRIALSGADVEYLFGEEEVLVEARHLVNGRAAIWGAEGSVGFSHGLLFDRHALIRTDGLWTESLYLGRIGRNTDLARATAPGDLSDRGQLPIHFGPVRRELLDFEAHALALTRQRSRAPIAA